LTDGIINIYKEKGYTSHDVVAKMRGILKMKKIGHTGTLDPDAEGVLPVCIGKGTRLVDMITDRDKTYETVCRLGIITDTQDLSGKVLHTSEVSVSEEQLKLAVKSYIGEYLQLPPMYSAIKVDGKKLYELARQGKEIERERRPVLIKDIRDLHYDSVAKEFSVTVECGKGTYIRTLLHDIGATLGCGGTMAKLVRTAVGNFRIENAIKLSELEALVREDKLQPYIVTLDEIFHSYPSLTMAPEFDKLVHNGNAFLPIHIIVPDPEPLLLPVRVYDSARNFIGIYQYDMEREIYKPVKMFL
jgi:tRNA pseudouridine55 synthase